MQPQIGISPKNLKGVTSLLSVVLADTHLKEAPGEYPSGKEMIKELLDDHETIIKELRKAVEECQDEFKDAGTADFLTGLMEDHETNAWRLRRYLD